MGDYLIVCRLGEDEADRRLSADLAAEASGQGASVSELNARAWIAVSGPCRPPVRTVGAWTLVGEVFHRHHPDLPAVRGESWDYERRMFARLWGRYVGIQFGRGDQPCALLRDPSGARECIAWRHGGLLLITASAADWLIRRLRPDWRINRARLAQALHDPLASTGPLLLDGPVALLPGSLQPLPLETPAAQLWRPADIARASLDDRSAPRDAARRLAAALDETVPALANISAPVAAEVSGGLDSSLVAASLVKAAPGAVRLWLNAVGATPEADERPYVEALAAHLGIAPQSVPHATGPGSPADLEDASSDFRPGLNGLDRPHDADWARRCEAAGVTGLMTGKGGDSILLQRATAEVFADLWRERGWRALRAPDVLELARANEISLWTLITRARRAAQRGHPPPRRDHPVLSPLEAPFTPHPWIEGLDAFGPAKALQIAGVADSVSRHGSSILTRVVDVRHPLCAQPVIETCLSMPAAVLTTGGRDRGLARLAFRDRLPPLILERRSKGDMTSIYGRKVQNNLDLLRPWLLEGRLAALGLLDADAVDRELSREALLWRGRYSTLSVAAAYEAWVRVWERRLGPVA